MGYQDAVVSQVRQGAAPAAWRVFTKKRGAIGAFFRGTAQDPDPLLVVTTEAVIEYVSSKKPLATVFFADLASVALRAEATTTSDSMTAWLRVWLDLHYTDGRKAKWQSATFKDDLRVIQQFLEAYGAYKALSLRRL
jgi:predicted PilT family ATPase